MGLLYLGCFPSTDETDISRINTLEIMETSFIKNAFNRVINGSDLKITKDSSQDRTTISGVREGRLVEITIRISTTILEFALNGEPQAVDLTIKVDGHAAYRGSLHSKDERSVLLACYYEAEKELKERNKEGANSAWKFIEYETY